MAPSGWEEEAGSRTEQSSPQRTRGSPAFERGDGQGIFSRTKYFWMHFWIKSQWV